MAQALINIAPLLRSEFTIEVTGTEARDIRQQELLNQIGMRQVFQRGTTLGVAPGWPVGRHDINRLAGEALIAADLFRRLGLLLTDVAAVSLVPELAYSDRGFSNGESVFDPQWLIKGRFENKDASPSPEFIGSFDIEAVGLSSPATFRSKLLSAFLQVNLTVGAPTVPAVPAVAPIAAEVVVAQGAFRAALQAMGKPAVVSAGTGVFTAGLGYVVYIRPKSDAVVKLEMAQREAEIFETMIRATPVDRCKMVQGILAMTGDFDDKIDGVCGPVTLKSIRRFMEKRGHSAHPYVDKTAIDHAPFLLLLSAARAKLVYSP